MAGANALLEDSPAPNALALAAKLVLGRASPAPAGGKALARAGGKALARAGGNALPLVEKALLLPEVLLFAFLLYQVSNALTGSLAGTGAGAKACAKTGDAAGRKENGCWLILCVTVMSPADWSREMV